jgi:post-segregation antitoxin (ccd killing protein)
MKHKKVKAVKKTLTIPQWLNELAISKNINFSQTLAEALRKELAEFIEEKQAQ